MKKIALIPIDNRPVCYQLPKQLLGLSKDCKLFIPDKSLLGSLTQSANNEALINWLEDIKDIDTIIISLDTIAYGGLIPSRKCNDDFSLIKKRIDKLKEIIIKKSVEVYAFSSIMRISNNNINEEEKEYWNLYGTKIFQYSYNLHKNELNSANKCLIEVYGQSSVDGTFLESLSDLKFKTDIIPQDILNDYLKTRKRNFEINQYYIDLKKQGVFNTLVFSKDDCAKYGLNVKEAECLIELSKNEENIFIKTGADEIPLVLLSRAINKKKHIKIAPLYINPESVNKISKYEDISVEKSVNSQIELSGGIISDIENCDLILMVNNFKNEQGELVMNVNERLFEGEIELPDKPYFIADILNANGSDNNFVKALLKKDSLKEFYGYAGWNTTGNTLGSVISAALIYYGAKHPNSLAFRTFQITRFLDDWAYQANVRDKIKNNKENLTNNNIKAAMQPFEKILFDKFGLKRVNTEYSFPWNRFFEIEISIRNIYTNIPFIDILFYE